MVQIINSYYEKSDSILVQGTPDVMRTYEEEGYYWEKGSNGSYIMVRPSKAIVEFLSEGDFHRQSVKSLIRETYGINSVTKNKLEQFVKDCKSGKIKLDYSFDKGLFRYY